MEEKKFATLFSFERNKDDQDLQLIPDGVDGLRHLRLINKFYKWNSNWSGRHICMRNNA